MAHDQILFQVSLETLRDLLLIVDEARFLFGVTIKVDQVERELNTIHCFLKDADARPDRYNSSMVFNLISELKDVASKAEDVIEKYVIEVASRKGGELKKKVKRFTGILGECASVHQVGKEIKIIRSRIATLFARVLVEAMPKLGESSSNDQLRPSSYGHQIEKHFVGMEKDIEDLVSLVKDDQSSNPVISIYGMGGLGKTSLAQKVFQHDGVQKCFAARAWISIPKTFEPKVIFQQMLKQIVCDEIKEEEINNMDKHEVYVKLYEALEKKQKWFVVIDDILMHDQWTLLRSVFPFAANCKVLITTSNETIAKQEYLHELDYLTEEQAWELLRKIALPTDLQGLATLGQYEVLGKEIVRKCGRLPLAISVTGGILRHKLTLNEWESVSRNIDSYVKRADGVDQEDIRAIQVLDMSYDSLPYYLKPCFLYLGCFPEGEEIDAQNMYLLWMAEGLVASEDKGINETLTDVAKRYLDELASRFMVETNVDQTHDSVFKPSPFQKSCRLHDLMRDLCLRKCEEERFINVIPSFSGSLNNIPPNDVGITRLAIHCDELVQDGSGKGQQALEDLRSLLIIKNFGDDGEAKARRNMILNDSDKFKFLRSLTLERWTCGNIKLPSELGNLIHMRYLSLFGSIVGELPSSVCSMLYLQTLDLRVCNAIRLPNLIHKIKRLKHLFLNYECREIIGRQSDHKLKFDGLNELETLQGFNSMFDETRDIHKLTSLQYLSGSVWDVASLAVIIWRRNPQRQLRETNLDIYNVDCFIRFGMHLEEMLRSQSLVSLKIFNCGIISDLRLYEPGMCTNLVSLLLEDFQTRTDVMGLLGKFPKLKVLEIRSSVQNEMICSANSFPQLKHLSLKLLLNLEKWRVDEGAMPNLSYLAIGACLSLKMIPDGLRQINTLRELVIWGMPKKFEERLRVDDDGEFEGEDYYKVSHISSISLGAGMNL